MVSDPEPHARRWLRPAVALPVIGALIVAVALLTPESSGARGGDPRLSTTNAGSMGARLLYELAVRLGWTAARAATDSLIAGPQTIVAVLDPVEPPTALQTHALLEQIRRGGALLYVLGSGALNDSLHVRIGAGGTFLPTPAGSDITVEDSAAAARRQPDIGIGDRAPSDNRGECRDRGLGAYDGALPMWIGEHMYLARLEFPKGRPPGSVSFADAVGSGLASSGPPHIAPVAVGFSYGAGRVVVVADPDLLRNDVLRVCAWGADVVAVRILEYLAASTQGERDHILFDEYHQGGGAHPGTLGAIVLYLRATRSGHLLLQALVGGLVLLLAAGPRALPAHELERIERRSPLEHVAALGRAYDQAGATRTATARLLSGVRRRVERTPGSGASGREVSDDAFLAAAEHAVPTLASDVALIRHALSIPLPPRELARVGGALRRLEASLLTRWQ